MTHQSRISCTVHVLDVQIHDGSGEDGNGMHTEMCTVHVPTADVEEMFSYNDSVDVSGNFMLPTSSTAVTQVHLEVVRHSVMLLSVELCDLYKSA